MTLAASMPDCREVTTGRHLRASPTPAPTALKAAAILEPVAGTAETLQARAAAAAHAGDWQKAANLYRNLLEQEPERAELQVQLGHALKESGDLEGAEAAYHAFLRTAPEDADIHLQLGHLARVRGDRMSARAWYQAASARSGADDTVAEDARREIEAIDRALLEERRRAALALTDTGDFAAAHAALSTLVEGDGCTDLTGILGNMAKELGRLEEAAAHYARFAAWAAGQAPRVRAVAALQLGHLAKIRRDHVGAITHFTAACDALWDQDTDTDTAALMAEIERETALCLGQITGALALWNAPK
ncbi:MAG: tetratricopeptide repeat protein [Pseudomonadota bacterium]